jgi:hypothetical protein
MILGSRLEAEKGIPYTDRHRRRLEDRLKFPRRVKLSPSLTVYVESEIDEWIAARIAERDKAEREKIKAAKAEDTKADDTAAEDGEVDDEEAADVAAA